MQGRFRQSGLTAAGLLILAAPSTRADEKHEPVPSSALGPMSVIESAGHCPRPDAVWAELVTLIPPERLKVRLAALTAGGNPAAEIVDLGDRYRILAAGQAREYRDPNRDCAYRARVAAVFTALAIDPAELPPADIAVPPAPAPVISPAPIPTNRLDLGVEAMAGFGTGDRVTAAGGALRWSGGRHWLGPEGGVAVFLPVDNTIGGIRLRQWRLPLDAGLRARVAGPRLERYVEVGVSAALLSERALDLVSPRSQTAIEVGLRVGMGLHAARARFAPFAALSAELVPRPPAVFALPAGTVGHTPYLWVGATAGLSLGFL